MAGGVIIAPDQQVVEGQEVSHTKTRSSDAQTATLASSQRTMDQQAVKGKETKHQLVAGEGQSAVVKHMQSSILRPQASKQPGYTARQPPWWKANPFQTEQNTQTGGWVGKTPNANSYLPEYKILAIRLIAWFLPTHVVGANYFYWRINIFAPTNMDYPPDDCNFDFFSTDCTGCICCLKDNS